MTTAEAPMDQIEKFMLKGLEIQLDLLGIQKQNNYGLQIMVEIC